MSFVTVHWEERLVAGSERVNRRNTGIFQHELDRAVRCHGFTKLTAATFDSARKHFHRAFPGARILKVED